MIRPNIRMLTIVFFLFIAPSFTSLAQEGLKAGTKAPGFELPDINGNKVALSSFSNKNIVVIHFWKSKWRECQAEFPSLIDLQEEIKQVKVLSINPIDLADRVKAESASLGLPFDVLVGRDSNILTEYKVTKLPRVLIIGKKGTIVLTEKYASYEKRKEEVEKALKKGL